MRESFKTAVRNIARFGDTDIFPFPLERHVLHDEEGAVLDLLEVAHAKFFAGGGNESFLSAHPPINVSMLAQIGHAGFRWATQIDPLWNAYLLGLVVSVSPAIESARIPASERSVFSYRLKHDPDNRTLFDTAFGWRDFMLDSIDRAKGGGYVVACDVSDFYPRVYHHTIENALLQVAGNSDIPKRVDSVLSAFSPNVAPKFVSTFRFRAHVVCCMTEPLLPSPAHCKWIGPRTRWAGIEMLFMIVVQRIQL